MSAHAPPTVAPPPPIERAPHRGVSERLRVAASGAVATVLGVLPHVLHHAGPLAGAALFAGAGGSLLFGAVGLVAAVPFLLRLHRRSGGWRLPSGALAAMVIMFALSTFVIGPWINGGSDSASPSKSQPANLDSHGH